MQGIGCFDGFYDEWIVENNVVITDHWHGISFYGMRDSRIVNNSVIDNIDGQPGPPWIMVTDHKNGTPSDNVVVRNNLADGFRAFAATTSPTITTSNTRTPRRFSSRRQFDLHLLPGAAAIDTGSADLAPNIDVEGHGRPQGAGYDIGAYEFPVDAIFASGFDNP